MRSFWSALEPHHTSVYVNFLMEEGEDRIREAYGSEKYDRLKALKRKYDPDELLPPQPEHPAGLAAVRLRSHMHVLTWERPRQPACMFGHQPRQGTVVAIHA